MAQDKIRVLIADDHQVVRKGLAALLAAEKYGIEVAGEAANGEEAVQRALSLEPDVILMDLAMPVKNGIEAIREIKAAQPAARILVLTSYAEDEQVVEAIRAGAYGLLMKDTSPDDLVHTIRSVYSGKLTLPQELIHVVMEGARLPAHMPEQAEQHGLTQREQDVLRCVARGLANKDIAAELSISKDTVRSHTSSLMRKLSLQNRTQLALYAREHGLV